MTGPALAADCGRCRALCCVAPAFVASADFGLTKAAGHPCPNLRGDDRCGIHAVLPERGFPGCVAYDCFGAGQQVVQVAFGGAPRSAEMLRAYEVARQLHELLFYAADALSRPAAAAVHPELAAARATLERLVASAAALGSTDPATHRRTIAPLLRRASTLARDPAGRALAGRALAGRALAGRDLVGRDLRGADLRRADLSTALLLGADLRRADLRGADLLGADLRGADLRGADLRDALYLTRTQLGATRRDPTTQVPPTLTDPPPS